MNTCKQIAKHFRDVYWGGNWTCVNLKDTLADVDWQQATASIHSFNTIATLVFHIHYYVDVVIKVFNNEPLTGKDALSFDHPPVTCAADWNQLLEKTWADAELFAGHIEQLPEEKLWHVFVNEKYGNYYRNLHGIIEHTHYHLGQIVLIKKLLREN